MVAGLGPKAGSITGTYPKNHVWPDQKAKSMPETGSRESPNLGEKSSTTVKETGKTGLLYPARNACCVVSCFLFSVPGSAGDHAGCVLRTMNCRPRQSPPDRKMEPESQIKGNKRLIAIRSRIFYNFTTLVLGRYILACCWGEAPNFF